MIEKSKRKRKMSTFINVFIGIITKTPEAIIPLVINEIIKRNNKKKTTSGNIEILKSITSVDLLFRQYKKSKSNEIVYFKQLIKKLYKYRDKILLEIRDYEKVIDQLSDENKLLYLRILYESQCFNSNLMKKYVELAINLNSKDNSTRFWMIQDMSEMVFRFPAYLYDNYYQNRKKAIKNYKKDLILSQINFDMKNDPMKNDACKKYAIVTNGLNSQSNAVSYLVYKYANELVRQGKTVAIFPNDSLIYYRNECIVRPIKSAVSCSAIMQHKHNKILDNRIKIYYTRGIKTKGRIKNCLNNIKNYSPDIVIDAAGQGSFFTVFIKGIYPIIHLSFNGYIVGTFFDKYISKYKRFTLELNETYHAMHPGKIEEILIGFNYKQPKKKFIRETYKILPNDFVYITVGNRLDVELKTDFISTVCNHLRSSACAKWFVVGSIDKNIFSDYQDLIIYKKIIMISYERDLTGLYKLCNAYIEPDRTGGGTSVFWAMYQGMPIVISDFWSDILPTVGIENSIKGGYPNFGEYMKKLENDKAFYQENSALMKKRAYYSNIRQYILSLVKVADNMRIKEEK